MGKKIGFLLFCVLSIIAISIGPLAVIEVQAAQPRILKWATFPPGSVNNVMVTGMALVSDNFYKSSSRVAAYTSYRSYVPLMNEGKVDFAVLNALDAWGAYNGKVPFYEEKHSDLRMLWAAPAGRVAVLVRADSKIKTLEDLRGATVTGGYDAHMVCRYLAAGALATAGLSSKDLTVYPVTTVLPGIQALMDGRVDAASCASPGMPIIQEADARVGVRWLPIETTTAAVERMQQVFAGSIVDSLKPGDAPGITKTIPVLGYHFYLTSSTHTDEKTVYGITKTLWEHNGDLSKIGKALAAWTNDVAVNASTTIPYHLGAIRFYKEKGIWTTEMDRLQEKLLSVK